MIVPVPADYDPQNERTWPAIEFDTTRDHFETILIEPEDIENEITLKALLEKNGLGQYHRTDAQKMWDLSYGWMEDWELEQYNAPPRPTEYDEEEDKIWFVATNDLII